MPRPWPLPRTRSNRWTLVLYATLFNLAFEYSIRGWNGFARQPVLLLILPVAYATYFAMLEDLLVRVRLHEVQAVLVTFLFGLFYEVLGTGVVFTATGIDWFSVVYVGVLWWGLIQTLLTFYFAGRVWPRDWGHPRMGAAGWAACLAAQAGILLLLARNPLLPHGPGWAYLVLALLGALVAAALVLSARAGPGAPRPFVPSRALDALALGTLVLFLASGTFLVGGFGVGAAAYINALAASVVTRATLVVAVLVAVAAAVYRAKGAEFPF